MTDLEIFCARATNQESSFIIINDEVTLSFDEENGPNLGIISKEISKEIKETCIESKDGSCKVINIQEAVEFFEKYTNNKINFSYEELKNLPEEELEVNFIGFLMDAVISKPTKDKNKNMMFSTFVAALKIYDATKNQKAKEFLSEFGPFHKNLKTDTIRTEQFVFNVDNIKFGDEGEN